MVAPNNNGFFFATTVDATWRFEGDSAKGSLRITNISRKPHRVILDVDFCDSDRLGLISNLCREANKVHPLCLSFVRKLAFGEIVLDPCDSRCFLQYQDFIDDTSGVVFNRMTEIFVSYDLERIAARGNCEASAGKNRFIIDGYPGYWVITDPMNGDFGLGLSLEVRLREPGSVDQLMDNEQVLIPDIPVYSSREIISLLNKLTSDP